jgi:hypothetical protein
LENAVTVVWRRVAFAAVFFAGAAAFFVVRRLVALRAGARFAAFLAGARFTVFRTVRFTVFRIVRFAAFFAGARRLTAFLAVARFTAIVVPLLCVSLFPSAAVIFSILLECSTPRIVLFVAVLVPTLPLQVVPGIDRRSSGRPLIDHCQVECLEPRAHRDHVRGHVRAKASKIALRHDDGEVDQRVLKPGESGV